MSGNKVKFHPQERLDLVDINAMQDLLHSGMGEEIGAFLAGKSPAGGLLWINGGVTYTHSNKHLLPADFVFAAPIADTAVTGLKQLRVGKYNSAAASNDPINIYAHQVAAQAYYAGNQGQMPSVTPKDSAYNASTWGLIYPVVYARVTYQDDTQDTRRFWDVAQAAEVSTVVNTRSTQVVKFLVVGDGVTPASPAGVSTGLSTEWIKLFQVSAWAYSATYGAVIPNDYRFFTYADNVLKLDDSNNALLSETWAASLRPTYGGGVPYVSTTLLELLKFHRTSGLNDTSVPTSYRVDTQLSESPKLSLDGLAGCVKASSVKEVRAHIDGRLDIIVSPWVAADSGYPSTGTITYRNADYAGDNSASSRLGWVNGSIVMDYTDFYAEYPNDTIAGNDNYVLTTKKHNAFILQLPSTYSGWLFDLSLACQRMEQDGVDGTGQALLSPNNISNNLPVSRVQQITYKDINNAEQQIYGVRLKFNTILLGANTYNASLNWLVPVTSTSFAEALNFRYGFTISLTLHNPNRVQY